MAPGDDIARFCLDCGYSLRGLPEPRCPECGRSFHPNDPFTFVVRPRVSPLAQRLGTPVGWPTNAATLIAVLLLLMGEASLRNESPAIEWGTLIGLATAIWFLLRGMACAFVTELYFQRHSPHDVRWRRWSIVPALWLILLLFHAADVPLHVGFWVSKSKMDSLAQRAAQLPSGSFLPDQWVGIYQATGVQATAGGGVSFWVREAAPPTGFVYSTSQIPSSIPPRTGFGGWWLDCHAFHEGWQICD